MMLFLCLAPSISIIRLSDPPPAVFDTPVAPVSHFHTHMCAGFRAHAHTHNQTRKIAYEKADSVTCTHIHSVHPHARGNHVGLDLMGVKSSFLSGALRCDMPSVSDVLFGGRHRSEGCDFLIQSN